MKARSQALKTTSDRWSCYRQRIQCLAEMVERFAIMKKHVYHTPQALHSTDLNPGDWKKSDVDDPTLSRRPTCRKNRKANLG